MIGRKWYRRAAVACPSWVADHFPCQVGLPSPTALSRLEVAILRWEHCQNLAATCRMLKRGGIDEGNSHPRRHRESR